MVCMHLVIITAINIGSYILSHILMILPSTYPQQQTGYVLSFNGYVFATAT